MMFPQPKRNPLLILIFSAVLFSSVAAQADTPTSPSSSAPTLLDRAMQLAAGAATVIGGRWLGGYIMVNAKKDPKKNNEDTGTQPPLLKAPQVNSDEYAIEFLGKDIDIPFDENESQFILHPNGKVTVVDGDKVTTTYKKRVEPAKDKDSDEPVAPRVAKVQKVSETEIRAVIAVDGYEKVFAKGLQGRNDLKLYPGGVLPWNWHDRMPHTSHSDGIQQKDVEPLIDEADIFILSRGVDLQVGINEETIKYLREEGKTVHVAQSEKALQLYNLLLGRGKRVAALIHITC